MMILEMVLFGLALAEGGRVRRIVGGYEADIEDYPYLVSLWSRNPGEGEVFFGGGSILNEHWVLTAAHCLSQQNQSLPRFPVVLHPRKLTNAYVVAGSKYSKEKGISYKIFFPIIHPNYRTHGRDDIALLRIKGRIQFNKYNVQPIKLPSGIFTGSTAVFAGWGAVWGGPKRMGEAVNVLRRIQLKIISNDRCLETHDRLSSAEICTLIGDGEGLCGGDSGSPLVANGVQVGIASYVRPCAKGLPDVFTRVSSYVDWIEEVQEKYERIIE